MEETVGIRLVASDFASGPVAAVRKELVGLGGAAGGVASTGLNLAGRAMGSIGGALSHLKNTMGGLITGPLGFLGLTAGVLGLGGALKAGIDTANNMALSIEKLTGLTGEDAAAMSGLLAVTGKFNISSDQLGTIVGFTEKTLGKLAETTAKAAKASKSAALAHLELEKASIQAAGGSTKLIDKLITEQKARDALTLAREKSLPAESKLLALQRQYGVVLTDSKGAALNFSQVLNNVSDYYNSNATAGQKAALAAQVFGRGYAVMIPVLKLGSKGFAEAQAAAQSLGLTLTSQNETDLKNYQETMRETGDAVGGLELQLSLKLMPAIRDVAAAATRFIADNRAGIVGFFQGLIDKARTAAGFLTGTIIPDLQSLAGAAVGFWNKIPPQLRDILVKGFIADRAMRFLFGFDPVTTVGTLIGKQILGSLAAGLGLVASKAIGGTVLSSLAARGSTPLNPLFVSVIGPGGIPGVPGAAGGAAAAGGGILSGASGALIGASAVAAAAVLIINANQGRQDLAAKAAAGDPIAIRTQGELATRGFQSPVAGNAASAASAVAPRNSGAAEGMRTLPTAVAAGAALVHQAIVGVLVAKLEAEAARFQLLFGKVIGITAGQREDIAKNLQLQRVLAEQHHRLTFAQLEHKSHVDAVEHMETMAKFDHLTIAQEATKRAIQAQKLALAITLKQNLAVQNATVAKGQQTFKVFNSGVYVE